MYTIFNDNELCFFFGLGDCDIVDFLYLEEFFVGDGIEFVIEDIIDGKRLGDGIIDFAHGVGT